MEDIILEQLGGNKFLAMTGAKVYRMSQKHLILKLRKNKSNANIFEVIYNYETDSYTVNFLKRTENRIDPDTGEIIMRKTILIDKTEDAYCDMLVPIFEEVTGYYTAL